MQVRIDQLIRGDIIIHPNTGERVTVMDSERNGVVHYDNTRGVRVLTDGDSFWSHESRRVELVGTR